jgi:hypothetical protein
MKGDISVECHFARGNEVARMFGFPGEYGNNNGVYAFGFVRNRNVRTAYAKIRISASDAIPGGECELDASLVAPNNAGGQPFLARISNLVDSKVDVGKIAPKTEVLEVIFK